MSEQEAVQHWVDGADMKRPTLTRRYGLNIAQLIKERLANSDYPVLQIFLFGSCAKDKTTPSSDIDIAVVCEPFGRSKIKEVVAFYSLIRDLDTRTEIVVLHPEDLENHYSTVAQEIKRHGVEV